MTTDKMRETLTRELNRKLELPEGTIRVICMRHERPQRVLMALPSGNGWTLEPVRGYAPGSSVESARSPHVERDGAPLPLDQARPGDVVVMPCPSCSTRPRVTFDRVCGVLDHVKSVGESKVPLSAFDLR